jgi:hypothetical protein
MTDYFIHKDAQRIPRGTDLGKLELMSFSNLDIYKELTARGQMKSITRYEQVNRQYAEADGEFVDHVHDSLAHALGTDLYREGLTSTGKWRSSQNGYKDSITYQMTAYVLKPLKG